MGYAERIKRWSEFERNVDMVKDYIRHFVHDVHEAADLFQEVGLRVWAHPTGPSDDDLFPAWCRGVVRYTAFEQHRRRRREELLMSVTVIATGFSSADDVEYDTGIPTPGPNAETIFAGREELSRIFQGVSRAAQRLLVQRYVFEKTAPEIASATHSSPTAVRMKLHRARASLVR